MSVNQEVDFCFSVEWREAENPVPACGPARSAINRRKTVRRESEVFIRNRPNSRAASSSANNESSPRRQDFSILPRSYLNQSPEHKTEITLITEPDITAHFGNRLVRGGQ